MTSASALKAAIELFHIPSNARALRSAALPEGLDLVLRIAVEDPWAEGHAAEVTGRPKEVTHRAACFYIEQVLFSPDADSYRVLGTNRDATTGQLRLHMALLLKWLHPDVNLEANPNSHRTHLARRVVSAWEQVKTLERRQAYDAGLPLQQGVIGKRSKGRKFGSRLSTRSIRLRSTSQKQLASDRKRSRPAHLKTNPFFAALVFFFRPRQRRE